MTITDFTAPFITEERRALIKHILQQRTRWLTVCIEDVYQPHNAAAVLRSCECFGVQDAYIVEENHAFRPSRDVVMGADKWLTLHHFNRTHADNLGTCIRSIKQRGYKIATTVLDAETIPLPELPVHEPLALVFGSEKSGVSPRMQEAADYKVKIPMYGFTQSFNISVSAALCLQDLTRRIRQAQVAWQLSDDEIASLTEEWYLKTVPRPEQLIKRWKQETQAIQNPV